MTATNTDPGGSTNEHRQSEVREIRSELRDKQSWIEDEELYLEVSKWILNSHKLPVGSIQARVQRRLMALQSDPKHKLWDHRGVDNPDDAFPDDCADCTHYGGRCPVVASKNGRDTLDRHFEEASSDEELLGRLTQYAAKHHCDVLQEEIEHGQTAFREFVDKGERLRLHVNDDVSDHDLSGLADLDGDYSFDSVSEKADTARSAAEFPSADVAAEVQTITEQVTADDEEEDDG